MKRVLVVRFSSLGDIVQTFPSLDYLVSAGDEVHVLTKDSFKPLFEIHGQIAKIHTIPNHASFWQLRTKVAELKALEFESVFDLHRNLRSRIVTMFLRRPFRRIKKFRLREIVLYVFRKQGYRILFARPLDRALEAIRTVGGQVVTLSPGLRVVRGGLEQLKVKKARFEKGYICIAAESAWRQKEWAIERFIAVAKWTVARGYGVVWLGLREVPAEARFEGTADLIGKLDLGEVAGVLAGAHLLVCNDSGLMHLSEAVGTPVAAIFGPTSRELGFPPRLDRSSIVEKPLWCRPCSKTGRLCIRPVERRKCLTDIDVQDVVRELERMLPNT